MNCPPNRLRFFRANKNFDSWRNGHRRTGTNRDDGESSRQACGRQAIENREAIEFELRQAKGLYLPSVDLEASTGVRRLDDSSRRALGEEHDALSPNEADEEALAPMGGLDGPLESVIQEADGIVARDQTPQDVLEVFGLLVSHDPNIGR